MYGKEPIFDSTLDAFVDLLKSHSVEVDDSRNEDTYSYISFPTRIDLESAVKILEPTIAFAPFAFEVIHDDEYEDESDRTYQLNIWLE